MTRRGGAGLGSGRGTREATRTSGPAPPPDDAQGTETTAAVVVFTTEELAGFLKEARGRNDRKVGRVKNARVDQRQSDLEMNFRGLVAEYAVSRYYGEGAVAGALGLRGDGGVEDLIIRGYVCQVKLNTHPENPYLYITKMNELRAEFFMLVVATDPQDLHEVHYVGFTSRHGFLLNGEIKNWGYGSRFVIPAIMLCAPTGFLLIEKKSTLASPTRILPGRPWETDARLLQLAELQRNEREGKA